MKNSQKFVEKIFQHNICKKWDIYWQKTCWGCQIKLKFGTQVNHFVLKKTPQNNFFIRGTHHCQNGIWNIQIFASIFLLSHNILQGKFEAKLKKKESESDIFLQILSEINIQLENEGCGGNLAQISNWHLYIGIAA